MLARTFEFFFSEKILNSTDKNYLGLLPNDTNYNFKMTDGMLLILGRQQNRGYDHTENTYLASSQTNFT